MLLNSKLHIDRREAAVNMKCLLFNNTSCSPKQKSTIVLLYKKLISIERSVIYAKFLLTNHATFSQNAEVRFHRFSFF